MSRSAYLVVGLVAASGTTALADEQLTIPKGGVVIDGFITVNLSKDEAGKPISVSPDIWYGVNDDLTIGLVHSSVGQTGILGAVGDSLCLSGSSNGCANLYQNVGADVRYRLKAPWVLDAGLIVESFSPSFDLGVKLGLDGRWRSGKLGFELQPNVFVELTNRVDGADATMTTAEVEGNGELLFVPATVSYAVAPAFELAAQVALIAPFSHTGDFFQVPVSVGARYAASPKLSIGLALSLPELIGGSALDTGLDARVLTLGGSYAL